MNANQAFGQYLRLLRERRGLSLEQVESLSSGFPEPIRKSYLSRCENGHQAIAFSRIVALSRIYEVPTEVLAQRLELDLEVERIGVELNDAQSFADLCGHTFEASRAGRIWIYYAGTRLMADHASEAPVVRPFRDRSSQVLLTRVYLASAAMHLGKLEFAHHELTHLAADRSASDRVRAILQDRLGIIAMRRGRPTEAVEHCDSAVALASTSESADLLSAMHLNRGEVLCRAGHPARAREEIRKALALEQRQGDLNSELTCHVALARNYLEEGNPRAAHRVLEAALRRAEGRESGRPAVRINMLLGEIYEQRGDLERAEERWRAALGLARELRDPFVRFETELFLLRLAVRRGEERTARVIARRMDRLLPQLPSSWDDVAEFKRLRARTQEMRVSHQTS